MSGWFRDDNLDALRRCLKPVRNTAADYDSLLDLVGNRRFVLIGEASHGTQEFYQERARITQRLIREKGFHAVAVEADWPDAYRANRYVRQSSDDRSADQALSSFERFPMWMWRNTVVRDFIEWLRSENESRPQGSTMVGFYGLDLYSLSASIQAVLRYLDKVDPEAARRARFRYSCLDHYAEDTQAYGYAASFGLTQSCEGEVVSQLIELQRRAAEYATRDGRIAEDEFFHAEQNARLVKNAEQYYRTMFHHHVSSWNLRDKHMTDTLEALATHLDARVGRSKIVVWEHNSHLGDARATDRANQGEWNVGQLVRERHGKDSLLIGFTTYTGTVTAASDWGGPQQRKRVRPGLPESCEALFHQLQVPQFLVLPAIDKEETDALRKARLERAIGVIYRPETERLSHYFHARLADQFDAVIHLDETSALEPLDQESEAIPAETPETYPSGV
jgi:erythromycin esterase-like protein